MYRKFIGFDYKYNYKLSYDTEYESLPTIN